MKNQHPQAGTLYIKNMVCPRCIKVVKMELEALGVDIRSIQLGEVRIGKALDREKLDQVRRALEENGFELMEDQKAKVIEKIKHAVLELVRNDVERSPATEKHSTFIAQFVGREYHTLSTLFSSVENITIERYIIVQRIEYVKELLKYGEFTLSEIAFKLGYSSVQHLSAQFKNVTGMTPSQCKNLNTPMRKPIDQVV